MIVYNNRYIRAISMAYQPRRGLFSQLLPQKHIQSEDKQNKKLTFSSLSKNKQKNQEWASPQIMSPSVKNVNMLHSQSKKIQPPAHDTYPSRQNQTNEYRLFGNLLKNQINQQSNIKLVTSKITPISSHLPSFNKQQQQPTNPTNFRKISSNPNANMEYFGDCSQLRDKKTQKRQERILKGESRHKIQKYFHQNPVIKARSSQKQNNCNKFNLEMVNSHIVKDHISTNSGGVMSETIVKEKIKVEPKQAKGKKATTNYHTFPPNQYYTHEHVAKQIENAEVEKQENSQNSFENVNMSTSSLKFDMSPYF